MEEKTAKKFFNKEEQAKAFYGIINNLINGKEDVVITRDNIYDQVEDYIRLSGRVFKNDNVRFAFRHSVINKVTELLNEFGYIKSSKIIEKTAKSRKNQSFMVCIPKTDLENLDNVIYSRFKVPVVKMSPATETTPTTTPGTTEVHSERMGKIRSTALMRLLRAMLETYNLGKNYISSGVIKTVAEFKTEVHLTRLIKNWKEYFKYTTGKELGVEINAKKHGLNFTNLSEDIMLLIEKIESDWGKDLSSIKEKLIEDREKESSVETEEQTSYDNYQEKEMIIEEEQPKISREYTSLEDFEISRRLFSIAGICKKRGLTNSINISDLSRILDKEIDIEMSPEVIADFISNYGSSYFSIAGNNISLNSEKDWQFIKKCHHPKLFVGSCSVFICNSTLSNLGKIAPMLRFTILKEFTRSKIVKIYYPCSVEGLMNMADMFNSFHGEEEIYDDSNLVNKIKRLNFIRTSLLLKEDLQSTIETL